MQMRLHLVLEVSMLYPVLQLEHIPFEQTWQLLITQAQTPLIKLCVLSQAEQAVLLEHVTQNSMPQVPLKQDCPSDVRVKPVSHLVQAVVLQFTQELPYFALQVVQVCRPSS
jgi:hypothetical protein